MSNTKQNYRILWSVTVFLLSIYVFDIAFLLSIIHIFVNTYICLTKFITKTITFTVFLLRNQKMRLKITINLI